MFAPNNRPLRNFVIRSRISFGVFLVLLAGAKSPDVRAEEVTATCQSCHETQTSQLKSSIHGFLECHECHGGEGSFKLSSSDLKRYTGLTSGRRPQFDHGEEFRGKPTRPQIPETCGTCHADVEYMNRFGLRTDQLVRYWTSQHGKALKEKSDENVAVCTDCHGTHDIMPAREPASKTYPVNVPATCATCHENGKLMGQYDLPMEIVDEYRHSVHGHLLLEEGDTGAPTCATCHGNHSAAPPGVADVGAVCGKCHQRAAEHFTHNVHADLPTHKKCVQCHGGGEDRHWHLIKRITQTPSEMIRRYEALIATNPDPDPAEIKFAVHPNPRAILEEAMPTCLECHDDPQDDEYLPHLDTILDLIAEGETTFVQTGARLEAAGRGILIVDRQRFTFEDAKTHLIAIAPLQHRLKADTVAAKVDELKEVCATVNAELDTLENGLRWRNRALLTIWAFAVVFSMACYAKYKQLKKLHVEPLREARD